MPRISWEEADRLQRASAGGDHSKKRKRGKSYSPRKQSRDRAVRDVPFPDTVLVDPGPPREEVKARKRVVWEVVSVATNECICSTTSYQEAQEAHRPGYVIRIYMEPVW